MLFRFVILILSFILLSSCQFDYSKLSSYAETGNIIAVIEIPAGTSLKIEYDSAAARFVPDIKNNKERIIEYLPYPANYGYIPKTKKSVEFGGDGDDLDIFVLSPAFEISTIIEVKVLGILKMKDNNENDSKVIAIPADISKRTINAESFMELNEKYPHIIEIIELWMLNYQQDKDIEILGWGDEKEAMIIIEQMASSDPMRI
jgi:inorganic pyrophosphatase